MSAIHALSQLSYSPDSGCAAIGAAASCECECASTRGRPSPATGASLVATKGTRDDRVTARALRDPKHDRSVSPEALEPIELALFGNKRVHHHIAKVDQHPATRAVALDSDRLATGLDRLLAHRVRDRLHLALTSAGADHEEVGDCRELRNIQHEDVLGLLIARSIDHDVRHGSGREVGHLYRRCSSM